MAEFKTQLESQIARIKAASRGGWSSDSIPGRNADSEVDEFIRLLRAETLENVANEIEDARQKALESKLSRAQEGRMIYAVGYLISAAQQIRGSGLTL